MIFQEPMSSLNPVYSIGFQLQEEIMFRQRHGMIVGVWILCLIIYLLAVR